MSLKFEKLERLIHIIRIVDKLGWVKSISAEYPEMLLPDVEKCMLAMVNDLEYSRMKVWEIEKEKEEKKDD